MKDNFYNKIGLGMYTVHQEARADLFAAFSNLAQMGYHSIEFYGEPGDYAPEKVRRALASNGLEMAGWHVEWRNLQENTYSSTVNYLQAVECPVVIVPCLGGKWNIGHDDSRECRDIWLYYAQLLNQLNEHLRKEGIQLGYHNHDHEFSLQYDGKSVFDLLYENLDASVIMELDTGNCIEGGGNPLEVLRKYRNRNIILHLKPYSHEKGFDVVLGEETDANNWQEILVESDVDFKRLLIECESTLLPGMENAKLCIEGLRRWAPASFR